MSKMKTSTKIGIGVGGYLAVALYDKFVSPIGLGKFNILRALIPNPHADALEVQAAQLERAGQFTAAASLREAAAAQEANG